MRKRKLILPAWIAVTLLIFVIVYSYMTNPFQPFSIVRNPYQAEYTSNKLVLHKKFELQVRSQWFHHEFAFVKCAYHIVAGVYFGGKKANGHDAATIMKEVETLRFNPDEPYLISGDHFSVLFPRNLGIFYLPTMDPRFAIDGEIWINRQKIYLLTTAYTLETFAKLHDVATTVVPIGPQSVTTINVYSYPSDALYGVLYALKTMISADEITRMYPYKGAVTRTIMTTDAARELVRIYKTNLRELLKKYFMRVYNPKTGLIRTDIHLSGTKDITMRNSSFYDNVILWKTLKLANDLGIEKYDGARLEAYKKRIIKAFWYEKGGYFLEDLSPESLENKYYSSDWLIVLSTGFLDISNQKERILYERAIQYLQKEKIDSPFGLKYQQTNRRSRQFPIVRLVVPSYGGSAIWSFWGTEYIKALLLLYKETGRQEYLTKAKQQLDAYTANIVKYKGFPEVYDAQGNMLVRPFYKSVRQTGWVINYEQALSMYACYTGGCKD